MDSLIKNIKKKLSTDNLVEMMKEAKVIDNNQIKEEDVRRTLEKIDPNDLVDAAELATKLSEVTELAKQEEIQRSQNAKLAEKAKPKKPKTEEKEDEELTIPDNITGFLD